MVPLHPEVHPQQIAYNLLITQQMLGHFPAQIIFPDCSNPGPGELFIYFPLLLFVAYQHQPNKEEKGEIPVSLALILCMTIQELNGV